MVILAEWNTPQTAQRMSTVAKVSRPNTSHCQFNPDSQQRQWPRLALLAPNTRQHGTNTIHREGQRFQFGESDDPQLRRHLIHNPKI
jgi:hypothetical protein